MITIDIESMELPEMRHPLSKVIIRYENGYEEVHGGRNFNCSVCGVNLHEDGIYHSQCKQCRTKND